MSKGKCQMLNITENIHLTFDIKHLTSYIKKGAGREGGKKIMPFSIIIPEIYLLNIKIIH